MFSKLIILIMLTCLFISCAINQITMDSIQNIEKSFSIEQLNEILSPKKPKFEFFISKNDKKYFIQIYDMVVRTERHYGQNNIKNGLAVVSFQFGGFTPPPPPTFDPIHKPSSSITTYTEPYAFIFEKDLLIYWGFFEELNKSEDEIIMNLSPDIQAEYERQKKLKITNTNDAGRIND